MKSIVFKIDEQLFKDIHIRAAERRKSVQDYMCGLIKADLTQNMGQDQAIETLLEKIADVQDTLRLADGLLENSAKQLQEKRTELAAEMSTELQQGGMTFV